MSQPTESAHCTTCSCHSARTNPTTQDTKKTVNTASDTTAVLAEALRAQSQALLVLVERDAPQPQPVPVPVPVPASPRCTTVLSERIGSITHEQWDSMSPERLAQLDGVLRSIIDAPVVADKSLLELARDVHGGLVTIGLDFKTADQCATFDSSRDWGMVRDRSLPAMVRMRAAVSGSRSTEKDQRWWADEVMRVVVRLMELRGM